MKVAACIQFIVEKFLLCCKVCEYCPSMSFSGLTNNLIVIVFIQINKFET